MMNGPDSLYNLIPRIRRTRDYRLYDFKGRRYLDLCLDGGRALLGHKPGRTVLMMKNSLEKGLAASYPGIWEQRLLKQLKALYPAIAACAVIFAGKGSYTLFRPFENDLPPGEGLFELLLPLPGSSGLKVICANKDSAGKLPEADTVPQFMYSGLCRAAADLAAFYKLVKPGRWAAFNSPLWKRTGPWLYPAVDKKRYAMLFNAFLEKGILISPDFEIPSCAAYQFTEGEIVPIKEIEREFF